MAELGRALFPRHHSGLIAATLLLFASGSFSAAQAQENPGEDLAASIRNRIPEDFWGEILVTRDGETIAEIARGMADHDAVPMTVDHLFDLASVSKQFTATAILRLQMQGKLSIDDRVTTHLESVLHRVRIDKVPLRIRHLLTHASGLPRAPELANLDFDNRDVVVRALLDLPNEVPPGRQFAYSNLNYFLLAAIIEIVSG